MGRIILVRHSMPAIDPGSPACNWVLSPQGVTSAEQLASNLVGFDLSRIVSSDEPKALQTAKILARAHHCRLDLDADLREHNRSAVQYLPRTDFEAAIARFFANPAELVFGSETAAEVLRRFRAAVERAQQANLRGDVLIVTHGTALTLYLTEAAGIDPLPFWLAMTMPMAVVLEGGTVSRL